MKVQMAKFTTLAIGFYYSCTRHAAYQSTIKQLEVLSHDSLVDPVTLKLIFNIQSPNEELHQTTLVSAALWLLVPSGLNRPYNPWLVSQPNWLRAVFAHTLSITIDLCH